MPIRSSYADIPDAELRDQTVQPQLFMLWNPDSGKWEPNEPGFSNAIKAYLNAPIMAQIAALETPRKIREAAIVGIAAMRALNDQVVALRGQLK